MGDYTRPEECVGAMEMYDHPNYKFFSQRTVVLYCLFVCFSFFSFFYSLEAYYPAPR